jgi:hypothetical protein
MSEVAILVPVLGRPEHAKVFMESLRANTPKGACDVYAINEWNNEETHDAWEREGAVILSRMGCDTFAQKINFGFRRTTQPWIFLVGSDVKFRPWWFQVAKKVMDRGFLVVGTNDLGTARVQSGDHATHMFIKRSYVDEYGASWDGPGVVCHEYHHWFVDEEIVLKAKLAGVFQAATGSIVEHLHPYFGRGEMDDVYRLGESNAKADQREFMERVKKYTDLVVSDA